MKTFRMIPEDAKAKLSILAGFQAPVIRKDKQEVRAEGKRRFDFACFTTKSKSRIIAALVFISIAGTALGGNGYGYGEHRRYGAQERRMDWRGYERPCVACVHPGYYQQAPVVVAPVVFYGEYGRGRCHHHGCHHRHEGYWGRRY
jgi:hypothetical protein